MNTNRYSKIKLNFFRFAIAIFVGLFSHNSFAQAVEITPSYGIQFGSKLNYGVNYIKAKESGQYGLTVGVEALDNVMAEVSWFHQGTEVRMRDIIYSPIESRLADLAMDWIMVGGTTYFPSGNIRPFFGGSLGVVILSPSNENFEIVQRSLSSDTRFAFAFKAGVNIMLTDVIGLNLQGNMFFPVQWGGAYVGAGYGGVGVSSTILIGGFSGGLVFRLL
jgi:opacity protein-like surface antigen